MNSDFLGRVKGLEDRKEKLRLALIARGQKELAQVFDDAWGTIWGEDDTSIWDDELSQSQFSRGVHDARDVVLRIVDVLEAGEGQDAKAGDEPGEGNVGEVFKLKPEYHGMGVDLRLFWKRIRTWLMQWRKR